MVTAIVGRKVGMTQVYDDQGVLHPVTVVQAGPCPVVQVKSDQPDPGTGKCDGYHAVQLGFEAVRPSRVRQPQLGHAKKAGVEATRVLREVRLPAADAEVEPGQSVTVEAFAEVKYVDVVGTSKGKGFAGVMKRHNFGGQQASHGVERKHRSPGSINGHATNLGTGPKPKKGKRMSGQMGNERVKTRKCKLIRVDTENHLLLIKGAIPGPKGGLLYIEKSKTAKVS